MKSFPLFLTVLVLGACASQPAKLPGTGAIEAAQALIASSKPWAAQAAYSLQNTDRGARVLVTCRACKNPDGSPVSAEYVVQVDGKGKATIVSGSE